MKRAKPVAKAQAAPTVRFVRAVGAPISTDEDAAIIGTEVMRFAEANRVEDVRSVNYAAFFATIEADPQHPMRRFYEWDLETAARKHWIDRTRVLVNSVRYYVPKLGDASRPEPITVYAEAPVRSDSGVAARRTHVVREDALAKDPVFMSAIGGQIRRIEDALVSLERFTSSRVPPVPIARLRDELRAAMNRYRGTLDVAAE